MAAKEQELRLKVTTDAKEAERQLKALDKAAKNAEQPIEVPIRAEGADKAEADIKAVGEAAEQAARKVEDIGNADPGSRLKPKVAEVDDATKTLNRSADGTKNAMANLVGNTAQDVTGLSGAFGSLGVAIGQVAEYTADAANEGGGLAKALQGAASVAGPMAALAVAAFAFQKVMGDMSKKTAEAKEANDAFTDSVLKGTGLVDDWAKSMDDAFSAGTLKGLDAMGKFVKDTLASTKDLEKTTTAFGQLGINVDDLGATFASADKDFRGWAQSLLEARGFTSDAAEQVVQLIAENDKLGDAIDSVSTKQIKGIVPPDEVKNLENYARGFSQVLDVVEKANFEEQARGINETARATGGFGDMVDKARAAGKTELDIMLEVNDALEDQEQKRRDGAQAAKDSGTILDQVGRQVEKAADMAADAMDKAKAAQDNWLIQNVDYQSTVDDFTDALDNLAEGVKKQRDANDEAAGSFEGNTKTARENRDALGEVYQKAVDMNGAMKDAGFSVDGAKVAMDNAAQSAYDMAIQMGYPQEEAQKIKDKILGIPTLVNTEVKYTEKGYEDRLAEQERLERDIHNTVYFAGVVDRELQDFIRQSNFGQAGGGGFSVSPSSAVVPASAPVVASRGLMGIEATSAALVPVAAPLAVSRARTVEVPVAINVNVSAGMVADTFQLQRAVVRGARSFQRISGRRAAA